MAKKISMLLATVTTLVFAVTATAGATTGLTSPSGTLVPPGTAITKTSVGTPVVTSSKLGELKCAKISLNGKVTKNNATEGAEGVGTGTGTASSCTTPSGASFAVDDLTMTSTIKSPASTPGQGTASFRFTVTLPGPQECHFEGVDVPGTYTANTDVFKLSKAPLKVAGTNCGTATLDAEFTIEITATKAQVVIM